MRIYNVLNNRLEEFVPIKENEVSMYVCGPTVYNYIHIGNARPVVVFDTVRRYFEYLGYKVKYVSNVTDVNDKIYKKALELGIDEFEHAKAMTDEYLKEIKELNCLDFYKTTKVTEYMPAIIDFIDLLMEKGFAYKTKSGDIYFRVNKIKDYGKLSGQRIEDLISGARVEVSEDKENPLDFVLWKADTVGKKFSADFGEGRPGWHTECICMIRDVFHDKIDIHGGGQDLRFPHHENEIAQSEAAYDNHLANYWMHNARLDLDNKKMSKSLGNLIWLKDALNEYGGNNVRFMLLQNHYRQTINYTEKFMADSIKEVDKISRAYKMAFQKLDLADAFSDEVNVDLMKEFEEAMNNDFNTNNALSVIQKAVKEVNTLTRSNDLANLAKSFNALKTMTSIFGLVFETKRLTDEEKDLFNKWEEARQNKDFETADKYRKLLNERGL